MSLPPPPPAPAATGGGGGQSSSSSVREGDEDARDVDEWVRRSREAWSTVMYQVCGKPGERAL